MRVSGIKLSTPHLFWIYSVTSILFVSGAFWTMLHFGGGETKIYPFESWALKIHGASAMFFLALFGTLIPIHFRRGWTSKLNRTNGVLVIIWSILLIATSYCLYYIADEDVRNFSSWSHIILGMTLPILLSFHVIFGKRARQRRMAGHPPH